MSKIQDAVNNLETELKEIFNKSHKLISLSWRTGSISSFDWPCEIHCFYSKGVDEDGTFLEEEIYKDKAFIKNPNYNKHESEIVHRICNLLKSVPENAGDNFKLTLTKNSLTVEKI